MQYGAVIGLGTNAGLTRSDEHTVSPPITGVPGFETLAAHRKYLREAVRARRQASGGALLGD